MAMPSNAFLFTYKENNGQYITGFSGISICDNWILTHGLLLQRINFNENQMLYDYFKNIFLKEIVILPKEITKILKFGIIRDRRSNNGILSRETPNFHNNFGIVVAAWNCKLLMRTFYDIFETWRYNQPSIEFLRSMFLLVYVITPQTPISINMPVIYNILNDLLQKTIGTITQGMNVQIVWTPQCDLMFWNSVTCGVITNIIEESIFTTDAFVFSMSEGSPVYVREPNCGTVLTGMVIAPLMIRNNAYLEYTFVANLTPCLLNVLKNKAICQFMSISSTISPLIDLYDRVHKSTVKVICENRRGTGILVDKENGLILTCSHIAEAPDKVKIKIVTYDRMYYVDTKVLYRNENMFDHPFDIAVLEVDLKNNENDLIPLELSDEYPMKGEEVICLGHSMPGLQPGISCGIICNCFPHMIMTSCCTPRGCSGSPIISRTNGKMLGMVVSVSINRRNIIYTRFNMSVPSALLHQPLKEYLRTKDPTVFNVYENKTNEVKQVWTPIHFKRL